MAEKRGKLEMRGQPLYVVCFVPVKDSFLTAGTATSNRSFAGPCQLYLSFAFSILAHSIWMSGWHLVLPQIAHESAMRSGRHHNLLEAPGVSVDLIHKFHHPSREGW